MDLQKLLPAPRRLQLHAGSVRISAPLDLQGARVERRLDPATLPGPQSYRLVVAEQGAHITGADEAGLFYGEQTLKQLVGPGPGIAELPAMEITDWPDFQHRGVMLDVSRDRVPTMETLLGLVEQLAGWKINQLQLYMEHTFAYAGHEPVWQEASPFTGDEIRRLDAFCRRRHVELVPNQNSFGHMHRWLVHEPYRRLAECPEGIDHPFSPDREPYSLCPTDPGSLQLLAELYDQLLPHFSSALFNVGLDETFDLGLGRSAERCRQLGTERVYLEFLQAVHRLVRDRGRRMQFWGDIIIKRPELIGELPRDAIALEWGYEADHPFERHARLFAGAGLEFYVCPGTSSWNSLGGRADNAVGNIAGAAASGLAAGASGLLVTDWGDNGHLQPLPASLPGLVAAAACSWNAAAAPSLDEMPGLLDLHALGEKAGVAGQAAMELGTAHLATGVALRNGTILSRLLLTPQAWPAPRIPETLGGAGLERALEQAGRAAARLAGARLARPDGELVLREYRWIADALQLACRLGLARLEVGLDRPLEAVPVAQRQRLRPQMEQLIAGHRELWQERSRTGGLQDSAARLERTLAELGSK